MSRIPYKRVLSVILSHAFSCISPLTPTFLIRRQVSTTRKEPDFFFIMKINHVMFTYPLTALILSSPNYLPSSNLGFHGPRKTSRRLPRGEQRGKLQGIDQSSFLLVNLIITSSSSPAAATLLCSLVSSIQLRIQKSSGSSS